MTRDEIEATLFTAIAGEPRIFLAKPTEAIAPGDRLREDIGFDSVGLLYLVLAIESAFDLAIEDTETSAESFGCWSDVLDWVESARA